MNLHNFLILSFVIIFNINPVDSSTHENELEFLVKPNNTFRYEITKAIDASLSLGRQQ